MLAGLLWMIGRSRSGTQSERWSKVRARVEKIEIHRGHDDETGDYFYPRITYAYDYDGRRYRSSRISFNEVSDATYDAAMQRWTGITAGSAITVRVNPDKPSQAVILPGYSPGSYLAMAILFALFIAALIHFEPVLKPLLGRWLSPLTAAVGAD